MNKLIYIFITLLVLTSCSKEESVTQEAIAFASFTSEVANASRGNGTEESATTREPLETYIRNFTVYGINGNLNGNTFAKSDVVFPNYKVWYQGGSAHTTASNSSNWEYVGVVNEKNQTIKYWDDNRNCHLFWAVGDMNKGDFATAEDGAKATFSDDGTVSTFTLPVSKPNSDADDLYYSDPKYVGKADYGKPVSLTFHRFCSKVRVGFYEDIKDIKDRPTRRYYVNEVKFYSVNEDGSFNTGTEANPVQPGDDVYLKGSFIDKVTATLTYRYAPQEDEVSMTNPVVTASSGNAEGATAQKRFLVGKLHVDNASFPTTSATPAWVIPGSADTTPTETDAQDAYFSVLPGSPVGQLSIMCDYKVHDSTTNTDTPFTQKIATIPAEYTLWQPGYAYTYIFKITERGEIYLADVKVEVQVWQQGAYPDQEWHNW